MLQPDPALRPCIADIVGHPWMADGYATVEEIRAELTKRQEVNKSRANEERQRKEAQKNQVDNAPRRGVPCKGKVYLCHETEPSAENAANIVRPDLKEYDLGSNHLYSVFSTFKPDYLLQQIADKLGEQRQEFEVSEKSWKVKFTVQRQLNEDAVIDAEEAGNGTVVEPIFEKA